MVDVSRRVGRAGAPVRVYILVLTHPLWRRQWRCSKLGLGLVHEIDLIFVTTTLERKVADVERVA